jgi:hypothetical protein
LREELADERSRESVSEWLMELGFFMARKLAERWI